MGTWESFGTPKILEFECRGQNTSHRDVLYIIGKLLKCRCRKWARMSHLNICNIIYGKKKGRESNCVATPLWPSVWVKPNTWKSWELEFFGTPECSELDSKGKNTSHWGVLGVIGKFLKRRYRKCPRIGNSDICSPSYGQKKVRESNWQFDSRLLKVGNRCLPDIRFERATWRWKDLDKGYNFGSDLVAIQLCSRELWRFKVPGVPPGQFRDSISGVPGICAIWM
jgi:hypothetical protein